MLVWIQYLKEFLEIMIGLYFKTNDPRKTILALLDQRHKNYSECSDERMPTDGLSIEEVSFGISETARLWFAKRG